MMDRLAELEARHSEIGRELSTPEAAANPSRLADLGRELARLEPIVAAVRELRDVDAQIADARAMTDDPDEEMRAMVRDELSTLEARRTVLTDDLRRQLVPRDPNDERT